MKESSMEAQKGPGFLGVPKKKGKKEEKAQSDRSAFIVAVAKKRRKIRQASKQASKRESKQARKRASERVEFPKLLPRKSGQT